MTSNLSALKSIAASGTLTVPVTIPNGSQSVEFQLNALYAAVAGTSGVTAQLKVSADGTTFANAAEGTFTVAPAATVLGTGSKKIFVAGPLKQDTSGPIVAAEVVLTNTDATNAVIVAVQTETSLYI